MVQLTEVVDEHFQEGQTGPEEDDFTDTGTDFVPSFFPYPASSLSIGSSIMDSAIVSFR